MMLHAQGESRFDRKTRLREIARRLTRQHGRRAWHAHGEPLDVLVATVLSQHTSDINSERAFTSLRERFPTWQEVVAAPADEVAAAIQAGGLANIKAPRIQRILQAVLDEMGAFSLEPLRAMSLEEARGWLTDLPGVGPKTAACVLLFSLGLPAMPVDTHVHRVSRRLGLIDESLSASDAHGELEALIGPSRDDAYALHMQFIQHGRAICKAKTPICTGCELRDLCPSARI